MAEQAEKYVNVKLRRYVVCQLGRSNIDVFTTILSQLCRIFSKGKYYIGVTGSSFGGFGQGQCKVAGVEPHVFQDHDILCSKL